jgi:hypothetical protein
VGQLEMKKPQEVIKKSIKDAKIIEIAAKLQVG